MNQDSTKLIPGLAEDFDLKYGLNVLWAGKTTIIAVTLVALGLGFLVTYMETPIFRARAVVQIEPPSQNLNSLSNPYPANAFNWFDHQNYYKSQYWIIKSKALGEEAVRKLNATGEIPFPNASNPGARFAAHVEVAPVPDTRLAQIGVIHPDPQTAALWANILAEAYVEKNIEAKIQTTRDIYSWLQERLAATQEAVQLSEDKLHEYTEGQDLLIPGDRQTLVSGTLEKFNDAFTTAKTRRIELQSTLAQFRALKNKGESLEAVPQVANDPLVQSLHMKRAGIEVELMELKNKYKEGHPEIKKRRTQMEQFQAVIDTQAERIMAGLEADYNQVSRRERELGSAVNGQRSLSIEQSRKAVQMEMLRGEAVSNKSLYEAILQKIKETDIASSLWSNNVSIVEKAAVPTSPIRPHPTTNMTLALLVGCACGCGVVLLRDFLDNTLKEQEDIETHLHADCLAVIPNHDDSADSIVTESYRTLRTSLLFSRNREKGNIILITSSIPKEGKSTTAINIAKALAESGEPTLLVDFDMRRGSIHREFRLYREPGLADYCARELNLDIIVQRTSLKNLSAVASGKLPPNPPALIGSPLIESFLQDCRERYTWVVMDTPPIASVTDPLLLANLADTVLLVVRYNEIDRKLARRCLASLRRSSGHFAGVVLNGVNPKQDTYHRYYGYYQEQLEPEAKAKVTRFRRPAAAS